jgi:hypothetical protein
MISLKKGLLGLFFTASFALLSACGGGSSDDVTACLEGGLSCPNYGTEVRTCCDDSSCWYETNGQSFSCDGQNCDYVGAPELANYCVGSGKDDLASGLLIEKAKNKALSIQLDQAHEDILK